MWKKITMPMDRDFLNSLNYKHITTPNNMDSDYHRLEAHDESGIAGMIDWNDKPRGGGQIKEIWVVGEHRHKGLATELYNRARDITPNLTHSTTMTPMGRGWANTLDDESSEHAQRLDDQYFWQ